MLRLYATVNVRRLGSGVVTSIDYNCKRQKEGKTERRTEGKTERRTERKKNVKKENGTLALR